MKKLKSQTVTDEQGRQRFHGAFTGGFSAGYFNTVGSEEGFQPKSFVSSRSSRAKITNQTAKDYMDSSDGLLGATLMAKKVIPCVRISMHFLRLLTFILRKLIVF